MSSPAPADAHALKCELAADVLCSFGKLRFAATGWSMLPSVWPGETLLVERVAPDQVRIGDLVLVGREGGPVLIASWVLRVILRIHAGLRKAMRCPFQILRWPRMSCLAASRTSSWRVSASQCPRS